LSEAEGVLLVEHLDASLSRLDIIVKNVSDLVVGESLTVDSLHVILQLDGGNRSSLGELSLELLLRDILWDESNKMLDLKASFWFLIIGLDADGAKSFSFL
jgi:hypothetical protein